MSHNRNNFIGRRGPAAVPSVPRKAARFASSHRYHDAPGLNVSTAKIGGLRFIKIGRLCLSFCITRTYRSL